MKERYEYIRKNYQDEGLEKITDKIVESWIIRQPEYQKALKELRHATKNANDKLNHAEYDANILKIAKEAFEHRKKMIEQLVSLYVGEFWAKPKQSLNSTSIEKEERERQNENIRQQLNEKLLTRKSKREHHGNHSQ